MDLNATLIVQFIVFLFFFLPLVAVPWLLVIWLIRRVFGKCKDKENNNG